MKIALGINNRTKLAEVQEYVNAGVDEFFLGYIPPEWSNKYGWELSINRRFIPSAQFNEKVEVENVVKQIHQNKCKVNLTLNDHEYSKKQIQLIISLLNDIRDIKFDAFIVSNVGLMLELRKRGFDEKIHVSIGGGCNNIETMQFFLENFDNIGRFILPRKLTLSEIEEIGRYAIENSLRLEVFGMAACCVFNDEYCFTWHGKSDTVFCRSPMYEFREVQPLIFGANWKEEILKEDIETYYKKHARHIGEITRQRNDYKENYPKRLFAAPNEIVLNLFANKIKCGLCAFQKFKDWGIEAIKLPMRDKNNLDILNLVKKTKQVIAASDTSPQFCQALLGDSHYCSGSNCYYDYPYSE